MNLNCKMPFLLKSVYKDFIWGGERLIQEYGKTTDCYPLAESWECSTHPNGESVIRSGAFLGENLSSILKLYPCMIGSHAEKIMNGELPILLKLIDAKEKLSIQVHPNDEYAYKNEKGQYGKTECWYVLDAEEDACLIIGFIHDMNKDEIKAALQLYLDDPQNTENAKFVEKFFNKVKVKKDDVFFIPAGTVHAIGKGILVAEVQQNSDLTYRLYDYNRKDKNGNLRDLHIHKAMDVLTYKAQYDVRQPIKVHRFYKGYVTESLVRCKYFELRRLILNGSARIKSYTTSFRILMCVEGEANILFLDDEICCLKGDTVFIPADSIEIEFRGSATFIDVSS